MNSAESSLPWRRMWALWLAGVIPLVGCALLVNVLGRRVAGIPFSWIYAGQLATDWLLWALLAPGVVWLARRFPIERHRWIQSVAKHAVFGTLISLAQLFAFTAISFYLLAPPDESARSLWVSYGYSLSVWFPYALLIYLTITIATHVVEAFRRDGAREVEAAVLRDQLSRAQLQALRMQLHPHFLFNTLNTVSVLLQEERTTQADDMVVALGELLSRSLDTIGRHEVTLAEELDFTRRYLGIEQSRFSDRLVIEVDAEPETVNAYVPSMILQPLVENAMRHGIERDATARRVRIEARRSNGQLSLAISDDGPGFGASRGSNGKGLGLRNTIRRLEELYGDAASLSIRSGASRGATIELKLPYHLMPVLDDSGRRELGREPSR